MASRQGQAAHPQGAFELGSFNGLPHPAVDEERAAVLLRDIQELSYREIADRLSLPEGTVKSRINRGRHELARQIRRLVSDQSADNEPE